MRGIFIVILCLCSSVELFAAKVKNRKTGDTFPVGKRKRRQKTL